MKSKAIKERLIVLISILVTLVIGVMTFVAIYLQTTKNYDDRATSSNQVVVNELWVSPQEKFNKASLQTLFDYLGGHDNTQLDEVAKLCEDTTDASQIRSVTYRDKTNVKDIIATLGNLEWELVYLSNDVNGNPVATLQLARVKNTYWESNTPSNGAYHNFNELKAYSHMSPGWTNTSFEVDYPACNYGTSYMRAVTLNNGGEYSTSASTLTEAEQDPNSAWAVYTMPEFGLTDYLVQPKDIPWQISQSAVKIIDADFDMLGESCGELEQAQYFTDLDTNIDAGVLTEKYHYDYWGNDYLWLPSLTEVGYNTWHTEDNVGRDTADLDFIGVKQSAEGLWKLSNIQRATSVENWVVRPTWTRSFTGADASYAFGLYDNRNAVGNTGIARVHTNGMARGGIGLYRPCLHLNLKSAWRDSEFAATTWGELRATKFDNEEEGEVIDPTLGTAENPYQIRTPQQLALLAYRTNIGEIRSDGKPWATFDYIQTADFKLGGYKWIAIGTSQYPFKGNYNGQNFNIDGIYLKTDDHGSTGNQGLFGYATATNKENKTIENVIITSGSISVFDEIVTTYGSSGSGKSGAILGNSQYYTIKNCINHADVEAGHDNVGYGDNEALWGLHGK